ncbi:MAG: NAD(P)-binding domain-containing protein, partial [Syntrophobacterales bacterium]
MTAKTTPETPPTLAVIGAGSWGTALAQLLGEKGSTVRLWVFESEVFQALHRDRVNATFLPGVILSSRISFTQDFGEALSGAEAAVMAVPSHVFREVLGNLSPHLPPATILLS